LAALHCLGFTIFILTHVQTYFKKKMQKETPKLDFPTLAGNATKTQSHEAALQSRFHPASLRAGGTGLGDVRPEARL